MTSLDLFVENRFERLIKRIQNSARIPLRLELWNGRRFDLSPSPTVKIAIPNRTALRYFLSPDLNKLGEAFVEGHIHVEGPIHEIFRTGVKLARAFATATHARFRRLMQHSRNLDRKAIQYHYDVSNEFYSLFLGDQMVYSCAYFPGEQDTLEEAQVHKLDHILTKLALKSGESFLDIGCGWGALIMRATKKYGAIATGITLSRNQYDYARERIRADGLEDRCTVELLDYRDLPASARFDKIASVGMFEHVGRKNLDIYFSGIRSHLNPGGLVLNHGITTSDIHNRPMALGAGEFIGRYVFPGGELPHLSLVIWEMSRAGLEVADVESLRRHYARTCRIWADRLEANREEAVQLAGDRRFRIWEVYLAGCAYGFAHGWMNIYQILGCRAEDAQHAPLPMTRQYMYEKRTDREPQDVVGEPCP